MQHLPCGGYGKPLDRLVVADEGQELTDPVNLDIRHAFREIFPNAANALDTSEWIRRAHV